MVGGLLGDEGERRGNVTAWDGYFKDCTTERQREALLDAYGVDAGGVPR